LILKIRNIAVVPGLINMIRRGDGRYQAACLTASSSQSCFLVEIFSNEGFAKTGKIFDPFQPIYTVFDFCRLINFSGMSES